MGDKNLYVKVGHSKNPKARFYSYSGSHYDALLAHQIPIGPKKLACEIERGYVRLLKDASIQLWQTREWFIVNENVRCLLEKWEVKYVYNLQNYDLKLG